MNIVKINFINEKIFNDKFIKDELDKYNKTMFFIYSKELYSIYKPLLNQNLNMLEKEYKIENTILIEVNKNLRNKLIKLFDRNLKYPAIIIFENNIPIIFSEDTLFLKKEYINTIINKIENYL